MPESWCHECNPAVLETADRPKMFLPLCPEHLAQVEPISDEVIERALEEGRKALEGALPPYMQPFPKWS